MPVCGEIAFQELQSLNVSETIEQVGMDSVTLSRARRFTIKVIVGLCPTITICSYESST